MSYDLPDLKLRPAPEWEAQRRDWQAVAEDCLYGHAPSEYRCRGEVISVEPAGDGRGRKETLRVAYGPDFAWHFDAVLWVPDALGRHAVVTWNQFSAKDWESCDTETALARGYIIAGFEREQLFEDRKGGRAPIREAFPEADFGAVRAWGLAHTMLADCLVTRDDVDASKLVCTGFSRGGKAALAAGVFDARFSVCAPVCSGAGGCGCFRYLGDAEGFCQDVTKVESLGRVGSVFPYWWSENYARWWPEPDPAQMGLEQTFPIDAHTLKALIAPRNLFSIEGRMDAWANPWGTALTREAAQPAFDLLGGRNEIKFHPGGHAFAREDWRALLDFCDSVFFAG